MSGADGLAEIWDVESGERLVVLTAPTGGVNDPSFSPDGSRIAIASAYGLVRLFDADTGAPQLSLQGLGCAAEGVAFSPDGMRLASTSWCQGVRIWALDIDDLLGIARRGAGRAITDEECRQYLHGIAARRDRRGAINSPLTGSKLDAIGSDSYLLDAVAILSAT